jgi:hypothetical protein
MEVQGEEDIQLLLINDLGTRWGELSASRPGRALAPGKGLHCTHCTVGWVGLRDFLDTQGRRKSLCSELSFGLYCRVK